ncbi:LysE family translocator [Brevibacillus fluminis]|uniref:LysE family translocator n=1 Tax=Brevibacillus fluminis TaxID=511487 RepID=A0A3M8CW32_9BACL|nr:LysE family translocator [Brevibacillus fluminis]RNB79729.1 LysE family translocator [Brevibacillus fluminis]
MSGYTVFLLAFAASAASPGPEIAGLLSRSLSGGILASLPLAFGIVLGKLLMLSAAVVGLSAIADGLGPIFVALKYGGAGYLFWLGFKKWKQAGRPIAAGESAKPVSVKAEIGLGLAMTLSNPLAIFFYVALLPSSIDMAGVTLVSYSFLCAIIIGVMVAVVIGYGIVAEVARKAFTSSSAKTLIDRLAGLMMFVSGLLIVIR